MAKVSYSNKAKTFTTSEVSRVIANLFKEGGECIRLAGTFNEGQHGAEETILLLADSQDMATINLADDQLSFTLSMDQVSSIANKDPDPKTTYQSVIENSFCSSYLGLDTVWRPVEIVACELRYL